MTKIALKIRKLALWLAVFAATLVAIFYTAPAYANNYHSWVSNSGNDGNNCLEATPCASFSAALAVTVAGGEVSCLNSGSFYQVTITSSVTIDCTGTVASPNGDDRSSCTNGITINVSGGVVTLRGLNITADTLPSCNTNGVAILAANTVTIENCVIMNFSQRGIDDTRTTGSTKLVVKNTIVRNNTGSGIAVAAAAKNSVVLDNVQSVGNAYGVAAATGNIVIVDRSVMSENSIAGVYADPGATISVDSGVISHNASYGVQANGTVLLANTEIMFNTSSISGATSSNGNNRIYGNGAGTTPTITAQQ